MRSGPRRRVAVAGVALSIAALAVAGGAASASPGDLDPGFGGAAHGRVEFDLGGDAALLGLAVQPGGSIVGVGFAAGGVAHDAVAYRLHADGRPDSRFWRVRLPGPTDANEAALAAVAQRDGKVVVVGVVTDAGGFSDMAVWRLTSTAALDTSFGTNGSGFMTYGLDDKDEVALDVALDPQGRIVVAGFRQALDRDIEVLRLTPEGAPDLTFNHGSPAFAPNHPGVDIARSLAVEPDGQLDVAANYEGATGTPVLRIIPGTATTDAALDPGFGGGDGIADVPGTLPVNNTDVAVAADGKVLMLGQVPTAGGSVDGTLVRLTSTGAVDDSFGSATGAHIDLNNSFETLETLMVLPRGGVAVVGSADGRTFVGKLRASGAPDLAMGTGGVRSLPDHPSASSGARGVVLSDGRIVTVQNLGGHTAVAYRLLGDLIVPSCAGKKATIVGTRTADHLVGTRRVDVIAGLGGADTITGLGKGDIVCGGWGPDTISGGTGADKLFGQAGRDTLSGGKGDDKLVGGTGHDTLHGGPGHDTLEP